MTSPAASPPCSCSSSPASSSLSQVSLVDALSISAPQQEFILVVSPPSEASLSTSPPDYSPPSTAQSDSFYGTTFQTSSSEDLSLPTYSLDPSTAEEPWTTSMWCFKWGFACPLIWIVGLMILWLPLQPFEESDEPDADKRFQLDEMLGVLRMTELKWARRCAWAMAVWLVMVLGAGMVVLWVMLCRR